ncbi:MAG: ComEC/Rec2 family competence protein [bacterium]
MRTRGVVFCAAVYAGISLSGSVLPLDRNESAAACALAGIVTVGNARAWPLVPFALGLWQSGAADAGFARRAVRRSLRYEGPFDVVCEDGAAMVLEVGERRVLVSEPPPDMPAPGRRGRALLRLDPFRSRAEPSGFRAEPWSASRGLHARGRVLGRVTQVGSTPGWLGSLRRGAYALRAHARRRLGFGRSEGGDLATALLLGDRSKLGPEVRNGFRRAGLAHVLALSGAHLAVLALGLATLFRTVRAPRTPTTVAVFVFVVAYTWLTGAAPPLVRACATVTLGTIADLAGRRSHGVDALGWGGGILLLACPPWIHDTGFRLSFVATAMLALFAGRDHGPEGHGLAAKVRSFFDAVVLSAIVTVATIPEIAGSFGLVSFLAPATNLAAGPPSAAALGWGGLAAFLPMPPRAAEALAHASDLGAAGLLAVVRASAHLPGGDVPVPALPPATVVLILMVACRLAAGGRPERFERQVLVVVAAVSLLAFLPRDRITFFDIGQGDSSLIEGGGGAVLVDTGPPDDTGLPPPSRAAVRRRRVRPVDAAVLTHAHADHSGGAGALLHDRATRLLVCRPDAVEGGPGLAEILRTAAERHVATQVPGASPLVFLGGRLVVRDPFAGAPLTGLGENDRSLAAAWRARGAAATLLGDGGAPPQDALRAAGALLPSPILLLPHHGSRWATSDALLAAVRPRLAVVSCGTGNTYGHPHREALEAARRARAALLRTDQDGTIAVTATRRGFRIRWTRAFPGPRCLFPAFPLPGSGAFP